MVICFNRVSHSTSGWSWTCSNPPALISCMLGLQIHQALLELRFVVREVFAGQSSRYTQRVSLWSAGKRYRSQREAPARPLRMVYTESGSSNWCLKSGSGRSWDGGVTYSSKKYGQFLNRNTRSSLWGGSWDVFTDVNSSLCRIVFH